MAISDRSAHVKAMARRPYVPGVHGPNGNPRMTDYGKQLREKQKAKHIYGLSERQFRNTFEEASGIRGNTGELFIKLLEQRLDNVVYRAGFAKTRAMARQAVGHAHFDVNGKKLNIPSYRVRPGDVVTIRKTKLGKGLWKGIDETLSHKERPSWMSVEPKEGTCKITSVPSGEELKQPFEVQRIVEFYSR